MTLINGMKISNDERQSNNPAKNPSINEILDKMQINYNNINSTNSQNNDVGIMSNNEQNTQSSSNKTSNNSDNSILMSLLPLLLNNKSNGISTETLKKEQNELLHTLIKNLNNPLLEKLFELLPNLTKKSSVKKVEAESVKKNEPKIDSFVKTSDYDTIN